MRARDITRIIPLKTKRVRRLIRESPNTYAKGEKNAKIAITELFKDNVAKFMLYVAPISSRAASKKKRNAIATGKIKIYPERSHV
jgi:hypothetical protein